MQHDREIEIQHQSLADILIPHGVHSTSVGLLWALGVRSIANVIDLTPAEAEQAGLTDVQLRTLRRVASEMSPSAGSAHSRKTASSHSSSRAESKYADLDDTADAKSPSSKAERAEAKRQAKLSQSAEVAEEKVERYNDLAAEKFVAAIDRLRAHGTSLLAVFQRMDTNGDGQLSGAELASGASELGVRLAHDELDGLIKRFDTKGEGWIDMYDFAQFIEHGDATAKEGDLTELLDELRRKLLKDHPAGRDFQREFSRFDKDWNGEVDYRELHQVLTRDFGYKHLTVHDAERIASHFPGTSPVNRGCIKYNDFVRFLQGSAQLGSTEAKEVERFDDTIFEKIVDALSGHARVAGLSAVFEDFDVNNDGFVSRAEFANACDKLGLRSCLTHREMLLVMEHFDKTGDGQISHAAFCEAFSAEMRHLERQGSGGSTVSSLSAGSYSRR